MPLPDISLAQFNRIASGSYNAGQIDFGTGKDGSVELVKVNNHVWRTSKNNVELSPERILEVKEAFLNALQKGGVGAEAMKEIRRQLGLPAEVDIPSGGQVQGDLKARYAPLTRAKVREILDKFANSGLGFTQEARAAVEYEELMAAKNTQYMSASHARKRDAVNMAAVSAHDARVLTGDAAMDAISLLSTACSLSELDARRDARCTGANAVNERSAQHTALVNSFRDLVSAAIKLLPANAHESPEFSLLGQTAKIVKGDDGRLSAVVGSGVLQTKVDLNIDADTFARRVIGRTVADMESLGATAVKGILDDFYDRDLECGMVVSETTSLTRSFAALVLANKSGDKVSFDALVDGKYNTGILVEMANRAIDGEDLGDTKAMLDAYHAKLQSDNAELPPEIKAMLEKVANIPLEKPADKSSEFMVREQIVGDIDQVVEAMPPPAADPVPKSLGDIGGLNGVKDFVADLVFSDDTMVGDVTINKTGGAMRKMLTSDRNIVALAEIIRNPAILDQVCAPQIAGAVKDGFGKMIRIIDDEFKAANNGKSLADAANDPDFTAQLSAFLKDTAKMLGTELAKFDNIILSMANKGCESIQGFVNSVFQVGTKSVNAQGGIVSDPYKNMTVDEIKAELRGKTLNQILDSAANSDSPGQVGFFRQVISTYFTSLSKADKRSCFAAALKYADTFDFRGLKDDALKSAQKAAVNKFTGAVLKGTSPLLQKMMQGLPKDIMGEYADALSDMKSSLAPIPRKIVQAHLMQLIKGSEGRIKSIELKKSLGAASVGEAFLCGFKYIGDDGQEHNDEFVVKIMRHDAETRVKREAEIFTEAAKKIPGMEKTWEGQLRQYMTEFDFTNEAKNVEDGVDLYDVAGKPGHPLQAIAPDVTSMKMSSLVKPQKNIMVAEVVPGKTVDSFFKAQIADIRTAADAVFKQDPTTKRIIWKDGPIDPATGKPRPVPVFKDDIPATSISNLQQWMAGRYRSLRGASQKILQATKAWFHEALLGSGKFHGDTHAGNLMVSGKTIAFIDFGNLYSLKERPDGVNERTELLRVITGAAFRDTNFMLGGLEKLMSPEGRAALADKTIRAKAAAILDTVLDKSKGSFSFNIVYRLQAAVVELQKLGLELPPQINCFIQSLVRLSNTVTEINTIVNQCKAMLDAANAMTQPPPQRDDLDLVGQAFDIFASEEGKKKVDGTPVYMKEIQSERFGGINKAMAKMFDPDGEYTLKVADRLLGAADPVAEAEKLANTLAAHGDREHNLQAAGILDPLDKALAKFKADYPAAATPEDREAAIRAFSERYTTCQSNMLQAMMMGCMLAQEIRPKDPDSFASAVTDVLFNSFDAMSKSLSGADELQLGKDASNIAYQELGLGYFESFVPSKVVDSLIADTKNLGGDRDYQVDIGV